MTSSSYEILFQVILEGAVKSLTASYPFLNLPVVRQIFTFTFTKIATAIYKQIALQALYLKIDLMVDSELKKYEQATQDLKTAIESKDEGKINEAKTKFKNSMRDLISMR